MRPERAIAPPGKLAAAQLDQNCFAIFGTRTVLAESPNLPGGAKHGLMFSGRICHNGLLPSRTAQFDASDLLLFSFYFSLLLRTVVGHCPDFIPKISGHALRRQPIRGFLRALSESRFFAQRKMVELRSSRIGCRSCGLFGDHPGYQPAGSARSASKLWLLNC